MGAGKSFNLDASCEWTNIATRNTVLNPVNLRTWVIFFTRRDATKASDFVQALKSTSLVMGMQVANPRMYELKDERTDTYVRSITESINPNVQMVVLICPTSRDDRYAAIKKLCCRDMPVPSQVINAKTISMQNKLRSVAQKISLQMMCKMGGELWSLQIPLVGGPVGGKLCKR
ncbi:PREDICTED: protein argonaute-3-like, partial [Priapulus caudatus]|uniref:Protein argonaute-3-like n=1 Tax=Priapulus caudatus TaxID=37621 RepID=A0ABM1DZ36_PRICU